MSARIALYQLACGHTMGCYDREHVHQPHRHRMFCDECMAWAEITARLH